MEREQLLEGSLHPEGGRFNLAAVREYIAEHYHEPLSIDQLAGMAGLRPKYFGELFKKTFGQSTLDYLTELRISRAKQYLQESDYLLREIAHKVGYSDEFYFSRKFKRKPESRLRRSSVNINGGLPPALQLRSGNCWPWILSRWPLRWIPNGLPIISTSITTGLKHILG